MIKSENIDNTFLKTLRNCFSMIALGETAYFQKKPYSFGLYLDHFDAIDFENYYLDIDKYHTKYSINHDFPDRLSTYLIKFSMILKICRLSTLIDYQKINKDLFLPMDEYEKLDHFNILIRYAKEVCVELDNFLKLE